jgi:ABC-2 type transport system ATP-binding protein
VNDTPIVEVTGLSKTYPGAERPAVDGIDLTIPGGGIFGLLGPNGAGKTTFLSMLCGLLAPGGGRLRVLGHDVRHHADRVKRLFGLVPQELALYPTLTGRENLDFFGRLYGLRGRHLKERVERALAIGQLEEFADRRAATYSGGLKRRLNLVIGLIHEPRLLVLDEPTVGIDPQSRRFIHDSLRALNAQGVSIIYTTHYMEEVESLCDHVAIIDHGRIIARGTLGELLGTYQHGAIELRTETPPDADAAEALRALPGVEAVAVDDRLITVTSNKPETTLPALLAALGERGIGVASLSMGTTHLEQVFLNLTGTRLRD